MVEERTEPCHGPSRCAVTEELFAITAAPPLTRPAAVEAAAAAAGLSVRLGAFDSDQYFSGGRTGRQAYPSHLPGLRSVRGGCWFVRGHARERMGGTPA